MFGYLCCVQPAGTSPFHSGLRDDGYSIQAGAILCGCATHQVDSSAFAGTVRFWFQHPCPLPFRRQRRRCYSRSHWYINKWAQANPFRRIISTRSSSLWRWREGRHGLATRSGVGGDGALPVGHLFSSAKPVVDFGVREFHALMFRHLHPGERTRRLTRAISACRTTTNINLSAACSREI
jgi:hypothetical protein